MDRQHRRLAHQYDQLRERIAETELRVEQLQNTLGAVAKEVGDVSVTHPCRRCERCFVLVRDDRLFCPECGYHRSV